MLVLECLSSPQDQCLSKWMYFSNVPNLLFSVCIIARISSIVPLMLALLQSFKPVHVTNISDSMFSMLVDIVTLVSLNLHINFSGGYLSTKLVYDGELLMSINTGLKVVNWDRSCTPKTMKVSTTDSLSYIFSLLFCLGFIKNSIEISFEKNFACDPSNFLNASENSFSPV